MNDEDEIESTPADVARLLREWASVLNIGSGAFVNEDLRGAAGLITEQATRISEQAGEIERLRAALGLMLRTHEWQGVTTEAVSAARAALAFDPRDELDAKADEIWEAHKKVRRAALAKGGSDD